MVMKVPSTPPPRGDILIVDDTPDNLRLLSTMLTERGYKVRSVINGSMALMGTKAAPPDLILLDINMPEMNGYEVCQCLKSDRQTCDIPVIFISALDEALDKVRAFETGGVDYITKPFQVEEVLARVENQLTLRQLQRQLQEKNTRLQQEIRDRTAAEMKVRQLNAELEDRVCQRTAQLEASNQALEKEISERRHAQDQLLYLALHDALTGLPNRALFMKQLEDDLQRTQREEKYCFAVLFLDCDRFKLVNDSLGHLVGDQLLIAIAHRLVACLPAADTLARMGGDEFAILLKDVTDISTASRIVEYIQAQLTQPFQLDEREIFINASIGIVLGTPNYEKPEHLLRDADTAMYRAKALGKARHQVFDAEMHAHALELLQLENDLRRAVERNEFVVHYQPIVCLSTGRIAGFEALVRWCHPERGFVSPGLFIPTAEETGLILPIGQWVLREACQQMQRWRQTNRVGGAAHLQTISVNLSPKQFSQPDLLKDIDQILQETGLVGSDLKLEITEGAIMENAESAAVLLQQLKERQIQLSIDDFGTGYCSLSYLHRFPVDTLKIDRSFVSRIGQAGENLEIVQAVVALADNLGMDAIAEGVETSNQLTHLRVLNCEFGQGYFFSEPLDRDTATLTLTTDPQW